MSFSRRDLVLGGSSAIASAALARHAAAQPAATNEVVLSGGYLRSFDPSIGDLASGDVHVRDGVIVAVAPSIAAPGVARRDLSNCVVMPGLIDSHWHMWNSTARGLAASGAGPFTKTMAALSKVWTPEASAIGVSLAAAEAIHGGITTVNNWAHNIKAAEFAEAEYQAMRASGLRGRFSYGYPQAARPDQPMDIAGLEAFRTRHFAAGPASLWSLGICVRGPDRSEPDVWRAEWAAARRLGLPITAHIASDRAAAAMGNIPKLKQEGLLGPDVLMVHATAASRGDLQLLAETGTMLAISPWTELEVGYGVPDINNLVASGVGVALSVDNTVLAGAADMFGVMKLTADLAAGQAAKQNAVTDRAVLDWAIGGGARALGVASLVGSLAPGRRADIIAIRRDALNTEPVGSVDALLTHAAQPDNVDFVMIDGVVHKQDGRLTRVDAAALRAQASAMIAQLRRKADI